jgi:hypothetical protein
MPAASHSPGGACVLAGGAQAPPSGSPPTARSGVSPHAPGSLPDRLVREGDKPDPDDFHDWARWSGTSFSPPPSSG